jgi:hypothetical protein
MKYLKSKTLGETYWKPRDSHFFLGLMKVKKQVLGFSTLNLYSGAQVRIWEDKWLGNFILKKQYPSLYYVTERNI